MPLQDLVQDNAVEETAQSQAQENGAPYGALEPRILISHFSILPPSNEYYGRLR
jgi:hypothetical protein